MRAEYLVFDGVIGASVLASAWFAPAMVRAFWRSAIAATLLGAALFVLWDASVVGRHWWFAADRVLGPTCLGLPVEEWLFFVVAPMACLLAWEGIVGGEGAQLR